MKNRKFIVSMDVTSIFIQIHHKTRVLNEFVERMKISTETILLLLIYINLREMLNILLSYVLYGPTGVPIELVLCSNQPLSAGQ